VTPPWSLVQPNKVAAQRERVAALNTRTDTAKMNRCDSENADRTDSKQWYSQIQQFS
jgi:hypothetical protein